MVRKQLKTARGRKFDMEQFTTGKDNTLALGNLGGERPINAKGDILGPGGQIEIKREEVVRQYYREELPKTKQTPISNENMMASGPPVVGTPGKIVKSDEVFQNPEDALRDFEGVSANLKSTRRSKKGDK